MKKIPKLRFKEFSDEWEEKKLGKIANFFSGGTPLTSKKEYYNGSIPFIKSGEISKSYTEQTISEEGLKNSSAKLVKKGDLLFALYGATSGEVALSKINGAINQAVLNIKSFKNNDVFIYYCFQREKKYILNKYLQGGQGNLSAEIIKKLYFTFPTLHEQEKIGKFLSSIDKKISLTEEKLELFRQYKKGVMQKIFSQEMRFKDSDGNNYPDWEEKILGEISDICTGKKDLEDKKENGVYPFFVRSQNIEKIDTYSYDGEAILIPGDGKIGEIFHYINGKFDYHQRVYKISDFNNIVGKYVYYYLENSFKRHALTYTAKATVDSLRLPVIKEFMLKLPCIEEQEKIGEFLSSIDEKIESIEKELEGLKEFKKGVLQKMFV